MTEPKTTVIPLGDTVLCDFCNEDYTTSPVSGGFVFAGHGICPTCAPQALADAKEYHEEHCIEMRCPANQSFGDFIRAYRGPNAEIRITSGGKP